MATYIFAVTYDGDIPGPDYTTLLANMQKSGRRFSQRSEREWGTSCYDEDDDVSQLKQALTQGMNDPSRMSINKNYNLDIPVEGISIVKDPFQS